MSVLVGDQFACIRITGRANFSSSIDFKTLLNELKQKGFSYFVLDLSGCTLMDSTFLGVLAGFGLKMMSNGDDQAEPAIELLNPNARIIDLLESLGVLHLFKVTQGPVTLPENAQPHTHEPVCSTKEEVTRACLEAHRTLMEINPQNAAKFKEVAQFLAEDLKKKKASP
jgi:anti-sigma B factor antagonist